jgi:hypothetical protein
MTDSDAWKVGVELELMAPPGRSRRDLADALAAWHGGVARRIFHPQSEFTTLEDVPVFENLTLGFAVETADGSRIASCVDDLTLIDDLASDAPPQPGWYRILSDDLRFLSLIEKTCDPSADAAEVLQPLAALFGTELTCHDDGTVVRVADRQGRSVAMAVPLPGERERPCELVTAPLGANRESRVRAHLEIARGLGFTVPAEAATHIHFDGNRLQNAATIARVISVFGHYRADLRRLVQTNPNCRRLGDWPKALYQAAGASGFDTLSWHGAADRLREAGARKYCDFNLVNLLAARSDKCTFEVRILPGLIEADAVLRAIRLFEALLEYCIGTQATAPRTTPSLTDLIGQLHLPDGDKSHWCGRLQAPRRSRFGF